MRFDIADLKRLVTVETKLVVVNFPHNPTGAAVSEHCGSAFQNGPASRLQHTEWNAQHALQVTDPVVPETVS